MPQPDVSCGLDYPVDDLVRVVVFFRTNREQRAKMVPLYAARIDDLGPGDFLRIDCGACSHTALLAPTFLSRLGLSPGNKVLDLKDRVRCRACGARGRAVVSVKWAKGIVNLDGRGMLLASVARRLGSEGPLLPIVLPRSNRAGPQKGALAPLS